MRGEARNGVRTLIGALILLGVFQALSYAIGTGAMLMIVPQDVASRLSGLPQALNIAMTKLHASGLYPAVLVATALSMLGGMSAWFGAAARLPFAVGVDRMLPKALGYRDPKTDAPTVAIWMQAVLVIPIMALSALGANLAGAYDFVRIDGRADLSSFHTFGCLPPTGSSSRGHPPGSTSARPVGPKWGGSSPCWAWP